MNRADIHTLLQMVGSHRIADREQWVSAECPFRHWRHEGGIDEHPSFGIKVGKNSVYNCYTCGAQGNLQKLGTRLAMLSGNDMEQVRNFLFLHENMAVTEDEIVERPTTPPIITEAALLKTFSVPDFTYRGLTEKTIKERMLLYDKEENRLVIPWRDKHGRIVGAKGRSLYKDSNLRYRLYEQLCRYDPKTYGVFYGMEYPLVPSKALVLVEGEMDELSLRQSGLVHNLWGCGGVGITPEQIRTLCNVRNPILFFLDSDDAGMGLKQRLFKKLKGLTTMYEITDYCGASDPDEAIQTGVIKTVLASARKKFK